MEEILFWNNGLFRQPYRYSFLYSKLMQNKYRYDAVDKILGITNATSPQGLTKLNKAKLGGTRCEAKKKETLKRISFLPLCDPLGVRTQDPNIKSVVLYQLS